MKRILFLIVSILTAININATIASGTCGTDASWILSDDSILTISGNGDMSWTTTNAPWYVTIPYSTLPHKIHSKSGQTYINCRSARFVL